MVDARHLHEQAKKYRDLAGDSAHPVLRRALFGLAEAYEKAAREIEEAAKDPSE